MRMSLLQFQGLRTFALAFFALLLSPFTWGQTYNFDGVPDGSTGTLNNGWVGFPTTGYRWEANSGTTGSGGTGPAVDHTLGTAAGIYMYVEASAPAAAGDTATLTSPNLVLTSFTNPGLGFWYHKFGAAMGDLYIDVFNGSAWVLDVDSIIGPVQGAETDPWLFKSISLGAFSGTIQIRFRAEYGSSFTGDMAIDDVALYEVPEYDFEVSNPGLNPPGYSIFPQEQLTNLTFSGTLTNNGALTGSNVTMKVSVGTFQDSVTVASLPSGANVPVATTNPFIGGIGIYDAAYEVYGAQTDTTSFNNFDTLRFEVSDTVYARDDSLATGSLGIGATATGVLGQNFEIYATDTITSVSFWLNGPTVGDTTFVELYDFTTTPQNVLGTTEPLIIPSATGAWYTLSFPCPIVVQPGTYFLGVNETGANVTLGTTTFNYLPNTTWVIFATNPWAPSESYGFPVTYLLRANFGHPTSVELGPDQQFCMGNSVTLDAGSGWSSFLWSTGDTSQTISVSAAGTYGITVTDGNGCTYSDSVNVSPFAMLSAGGNNAVSACESETSVDLMASLGGTPDMGGSWNDDNSSGGLSGSSLDATVAGVGTFDYTYSITDSCGNTNTATVTLTIDPEVSAGTAGAGDACDDETAVDLSTFLSAGADTGGTWSDDDNTGALSGNTFNAATAGAGTYNFTYTVLGGACPDASATITITVSVCIGLDPGANLSFQLYPNPGSDHFRIELEKPASDDTEIILYNLLGKAVFQGQLAKGSLLLNVNLPELSSGVYLLELNDGERVARKRWLRN